MRRTLEGKEKQELSTAAAGGDGRGGVHWLMVLVVRGEAIGNARSEHGCAMEWLRVPSRYATRQFQLLSVQYVVDLYDPECPAREGGICC